MTGVSGGAASEGGASRPSASWVRAVDATAPGPELAARLAAVDADSLDDYALVEHLAATERLIAWATSLQLSAAADFARRPSRIERAGEDRVAVRAGWAPRGEWARAFADEEVAARLRISRQAASSWIQLGCALVRLPATRRALHGGRIDLGRARVLVEELAALDPSAAREVEAAVIADAARKPAARLRTQVRRAAIAADSVAAAGRYARARSERRVVITPAVDGMADLWAHLPAVEATAIGTAINAAARAAKAASLPGDSRTMDQRRADLLAAPFVRALETGVLDGADPAPLAGRRGERAALHVTAAASTLLGLDDAPAQLRGYGPITADVARAIAPDARWRRILTDPRSGTVLDVGTTTYRPPAPMQRHVEVRDQLCSAPGCGWPAESTELDHTIPFPAGPTSAANLKPRCARHHRFKHSGTVRVERQGDLRERWTLPTGHTYDVEPPDIAPPPNGEADYRDGPDPPRMGP